MSSAPTPGVCRYCGCREGDPCWVCRADSGEPCFTDDQHTVCRGPQCIKAEQRRLAALRLPKPRSRFHELIAMGYGKGAAGIQIKKEEALQRARRRKKLKAGRKAA